MLQGASIPLIAKICAAVVVTGGAGVATYEIADLGAPEVTVVAVSTDSEDPNALAFAEDELKAEASGGVAIEGNESDKPGEEGIEEDEGEPDDEKDHDEKSDHEEEIDKDDKDHKDEDGDEHEIDEVDTEAPEVVILWPEDNAHYDDEWVVFEGEAEPGASVFAGPYAADVDDDGNWRIELRLSPGANKAVIHAKDEAGNVGEDSVTVWLEVEEVDEPKDEEGDHEEDDEIEVSFSANQQYGSCEQDNPYDVFWGTATPNTLVTISSAYGSATAEVGKKGHWEKKVYFETAPKNVEFAVTVTAENGSQTFEFVALAPVHEEEGEGHEKEGEGDGHEDEGDGHEG